MSTYEHGHDSDSTPSELRRPLDQTAQWDVSRQGPRRTVGAAGHNARMTYEHPAIADPLVFLRGAFLELGRKVGPGDRTLMEAAHAVDRLSDLLAESGAAADERAPVGHSHDARTTPVDCADASLFELAGAKLDDRDATLAHGLAAVHELARLVEEARNVATDLYLVHYEQGTLEKALAELTVLPAWLTDEPQDEQLPLG
jgi:hypothetical protein